MRNLIPLLSFPTVPFKSDILCIEMVRNEERIEWLRNEERIEGVRNEENQLISGKQEGKIA